MAFSYSVVLTDPSNTGGSYDPLLVTDLTAALADWSNYLNGLGTLVVNLVISSTSTGRANGGPTAGIADGTTASGATIVESSAAYELATGNHVANTTSDITITVDPAYAATLFLNPSPGNGATIPNNEIDAVSVFRHEIEHGFGMDGYYNQNGVAAYGTGKGGYLTTYDTLIQMNADGTADFIGTNAEAVFGGPVPVTTDSTTENYYHLANSATAPNGQDLMNGQYFYYGTSYQISALDVAILQDTGISTNTPSSIISGYYLTILGRAADSAGLANLVAAVNKGETYAQVQAGLANSAEAQTDLSNLYQAVLGRAADTGGLATYTNYLATGGSLAGTRAALAGSAEAQGDLANLYQSVLGRAADSGGLASLTQYLAGTGTLVGARATLARSAEAQTDLSNLYQFVLGRAADSGGLASFTQFLATGGTLAGARAGLAGSGEAQNDLSNLYQSVLARAADASGLASFTQYLAGAGTLAGARTVLAASSEAQTDLSNMYQAVLGRAADAGGLASFTQRLANGESLASVRADLANSTEAQGKVTALLQADEGHAPSSAEIAAGQVQLASGLSLGDLNTQTLNLASSPNFFTGTGGTVTATAGVDVIAFGPGTFGVNTVSGFNPANDILQFSRTQFANVAGVTSDESATSGGVLIALNASNSILLQGVSLSALVPADFRFT